MSELLDFVALSLLPTWRRRHAAEALRAGERPSAVVARFAAARSPDAGACEGTLRAAGFNGRQNRRVDYAVFSLLPGDTR